VHAATPGREHAEAPVTDLVAEALDDDRAVGGEGACRGSLLAQVGDEVARGALVEPVAVGEFARVGVDCAAHELADRAA